MTKTVLESWFSLLLVGCWAGCAHSSPNAPKSDGGASPDSVAEIKTRAAFDLGCPEEQVEVSVIQEGNLMRAWTFGASGCDKQASYLYRAGTIVKN